MPSARSQAILTAETATDGTRRSGRGVSRRTLVAGTAWALPAVVVATAAPALAASTACTYTFRIRGNSCRYTGPGSTRYQVLYEINRPTSCAAQATTLTVITTGVPTAVQARTTFFFAAGQTQLFTDGYVFLYTDDLETGVTVSYSDTVGGPFSAPVAATGSLATVGSC